LGGFVAAFLDDKYSAASYDKAKVNDIQISIRVCLMCSCFVFNIQECFAGDYALGPSTSDGEKPAASRHYIISG
jgi:hypothetical protein